MTKSGDGIKNSNNEVKSFFLASVSFWELNCQDLGWNRMEHIQGIWPSVDTGSIANTGGKGTVPASSWTSAGKGEFVF